MSDNSKIEWCNATWNPISGCTKVSPGCDHCYAERVTERFHGKGSFETVVLHPDRLDQPLRWRKPRRIFVNSMSDLFHEDVPDEWIDRAFAVMALCTQHTFQVLTKRSERMRRYVTIGGSSWRVLDAMCRLTRTTGAQSHWPLPNVWLGVSAERQREADQRVPDLLATYAAVRFVSAEPLLGPIDFNAPIYHGAVGITHKGYLRNRSEPDDYQFHSPKLDWLIVGGESGPGARPMHSDWARSIRDQCEAAGVAFFFKQWGAWAPVHDLPIAEDLRNERRRPGDDYGAWLPNGEWRHPAPTVRPGDLLMVRVGKAKAGRLLDGRAWNGMPATPTLQHARTAEAVA